MFKSSQKDQVNSKNANCNSLGNDDDPCPVNRKDERMSMVSIVSTDPSYRALKGKDEFANR